jgi:hypothetical protein
MLRGEDTGVWSSSDGANNLAAAPAEVAEVEEVGGSVGEGVGMEEGAVGVGIMLIDCVMFFTC